MALVVQDGVYVWQKVQKAIANACPADQAVFRALKNYLVTQGNNPQLQFIPFTAENAVTDGGVDLVGAACTVYGFYAKGRRTSGTTAAFLALHAAATNGATTTTLVTARFKATGQSFSFAAPLGLAAETGLTIASATAVGGATESTAADVADGFVIVG